MVYTETEGGFAWLISVSCPETKGGLSGERLAYQHADHVELQVGDDVLARLLQRADVTHAIHTHSTAHQPFEPRVHTLFLLFVCS